MVIYKAEFPNGKIYIGKTKNIEDRKEKHYFSTRYGSKTKMAFAIKKYGYDSIKWDILFSTNCELLLNEKEKELIKYFNSIKNGYNISMGGDGGDTITNNPRRLDIIKQQLESKGMNPDKYIVIDEELSTVIKDDYINNKFSIKKLVKKYKISKQRLTRFLKSQNIEIDKNRCVLTNSKLFDNFFINKVINLHKEGKTIKDISEQEELTIMIVSRILHDSGVRKSKRFKDGKRYDGRQPKKRELNNQIG